MWDADHREESITLCQLQMMFLVFMRTGIELQQRDTEIGFIFLM